MNEIKKKVIAVDIDGTLCKETCWNDEEILNATPDINAINAINKLFKNNFIVIYTARRHDLYQSTVIWLKQHGVAYHAIQMEKMPFNLYIDSDTLKPNEL